QPSGHTLFELLAEYEEHVLVGERKTPDLIPRTESEKRYKLNRYRALWGERLITSISVQDIASFLNDLSKTSKHAYIKHRSLLKDLFAFSIHQGYRDTNPAEVTRTITAPERKKHRHTLEGYQAIRAIAPDWLQNAMDIALLSLQRRSDLTGLHRNQIDLEKNTIRILQDKTRNYSEPVYIEIEMGEELRAAVDRCLNSGLDCPYLLNTKPLRITKKIQAAKPHLYAITSDHLTKTFQGYRDKSGVYEHLDAKLRPSFHPLRALGIWLYEKAGHDYAYISALSGHATDRQLQAYKAGHEAPKPKKVSAELSLRSIL
ncbi:MAG TPA: tyrosine-type recombinase/integrase, partial [Thiolinea sp.]|nr:tyrosine-type recombinase/integrase [Thiolinea sp.]